MSRSLCYGVLLSFVVGVCPTPTFGQTLNATSIIKQNPSRGLCVLLNVTDPKLPITVAKGSELTLFIQIDDAKKVQAMRKAIAKTGLLGTRIYVDHGDLKQIHLANDLADSLYSTLPAKVSPTEAMRVVHPGGTANLNGKTMVKKFSKDTDEWRHPYHAPDNNPQSLDRKARGPFVTQFMAEPWYAAMPQMSVISGGRLFKLCGNRTSKQPQWGMLNTLLAMNAYNGTILWKKKLKAGFMWHRNTLVATPDTLFLGDDKSCKLIDPATGKVRDEVIAPKELSDGPVWSWMAVQDGTLYALVGKEEPPVDTVKTGPFRGAGWPWWRYKEYGFGFGRTILAINPKTKKVLWHHREKDFIDMRSLCMTKDRIFFYSDQKFLGCLNAKTGKVVWKTEDKKVLDAIGGHQRAQFPLAGFSTSSFMKCSDDALFFAGPTRSNLVAVSAKDGKLLWQRENGNCQLVLRDEGLFALGSGRRNEAMSSYQLDPLTGKVLAQFPSRDRCTRATGCYDAIFTRGGKGGSTAVFKVSNDKPSMDLISPMRPACQDGVLVAHGNLFWGPWMCRCDATQIGVISLTPGAAFNLAASATEQDRLRINPDPKRLFPEPDSFLDWPTYRQNNARLAYTNQSLPKTIRKNWTFTPKSKAVITAPIAVGQRVYVAGGDGSIRAIDSRTGELVWQSHTGGQVKYPPTYSRGNLFVGSGDGWIYCLDAQSGDEVWKFRAAPSERKIPIHGSLISTWPVGTGVLVDNGVAYAAAGNANFDGTHVYALDARTGKIRWQNNDSGHLIDKDKSGAGVQGHLLLHKNYIYMPGGNLTGVVAYNTKDGSFQRVGNGIGKDLYVVKNSVQASGVGLYWRPQDSHYIAAAGLETPVGLIAIYQNTVALIDPKSDLKKPKSLWRVNPFGENAAVAVGKNAVIVAGVDRDKNEQNKTTAAVCALSLKDGKEMWRYDLPADPVSWGLAVNREGQILVSLQDGRVVCLSRKE